MNTHKIDICSLSETKKKGKGTSKYQNYILIYSGKEKESYASSGVGLLLHEKFENNLESIQYVNHRMMTTTLVVEGSKLHLISVYAPDISKHECETEAFYNQLQDVLDKIPTNEKIIILGDLNARVGKDIIHGIKQKYNEDIINSNGEALINFCAQNSLRINNTFFPHKSQHKYTWSDTQGHQSTLDYIVTNREILPAQIRDVRTLTSPNVGSDHKLVLAKIDMKITPLKQIPPKYVGRINIETMEDDTTKWLYKQRLREKFQINSVTEEDSVEDSWNKIEKNVLDAAVESMGKRRVNINGRKMTKPWFTTEVKELASEKRRAYLQYRSNQTEENCRQYKEVRNQANNQIRKLKREYWVRFTKDMEKDLYGSQRKVWKMLKARKQPINEYNPLNKIDGREWTAYIEELYNGQTDQLDEESDEPGNGERMDVTEQEVEEAVGKLKNRKAPGPDGICNELIKHGGNELVKNITKLFQKILNHQNIPDKWRTSFTIPIHKKGDKKRPENYRTITLLNTTLKLLTKILSTEISKRYNIREEQQGFRHNRSTLDAVFILKQITEKAIEFDVPAFLCFIDLTKAFDRVRLKHVLNILKEEGIPNQIIQTIKDINANNKTRLKINNEETAEIDVTSGIRQGDSLSPLLFNLIMDKLIQEVEVKGKGYRMGEHDVKILCYADDAVIIAENEDELQRMVHNFGNIARTYNMQISTAKTKCLVVAREQRRCKIVINEAIIQQVSTFEYLGVEISNYGFLRDGVRKQANKAARVSGCLRDIIWRNGDMSMEGKARIYKACVRPILTYAAETRADTAETKRILRTTEMKTLRAMAGKTLRDRIPNSQIRELCNTQDIVRWSRQRRREWNQHVGRMDDGRLARIVRDERPHGTRPRGRPPKRWRESWQSTSQN